MFISYYFLICLFSLCIFINLSSFVSGCLIVMLLINHFPTVWYDINAKYSYNQSI